MVTPCFKFILFLVHLPSSAFLLFFDICIMDVDFKLSSGACVQIIKAPIDDTSAWSLQPTVQLLSIKKVTNVGTGQSPDRYRLIVSDGTHFIQAMLATQLNHLVDNETIKKLCVVVLEKYASNVVQNKRCAPRGVDSPPHPLFETCWLILSYYKTYHCYVCSRSWNSARETRKSAVS